MSVGVIGSAGAGAGSELVVEAVVDGSVSGSSSHTVTANAATAITAHNGDPAKQRRTAPFFRSSEHLWIAAWDIAVRVVGHMSSAFWIKGKWSCGVFVPLTYGDSFVDIWVCSSTMCRARIMSAASSRYFEISDVSRRSIEADAVRIFYSRGCSRERLIAY